MNVYNATEEMNFCPDGTGSEELTVSNTPVAATPLGPRTTHAMISVKMNPVMMAFSGNPATNGKGILLPVGTRMILKKFALATAKFIEAEGGKGAPAVIGIEPGTF